MVVAYVIIVSAQAGWLNVFRCLRVYNEVTACLWVFWLQKELSKQYHVAITCLFILNIRPTPNESQESLQYLVLFHH